MTHQHGRAIVLLEGVDKTGKSTEANVLVDRLFEFGPVNLLHNGPPAPGEDLFRIYLQQLVDADSFEGSTVIDRLHWSEAAYSRTFRPDSPRLTDYALNALDTVMKQVGGLIVWKTRPLMEIVDAMDEHDYKHVLDKAKRLNHVANLSGAFSVRYGERRVTAFPSPFGPKDITYLETAANLRSISLQTKEYR